MSEEENESEIIQEEPEITIHKEDRGLPPVDEYPDLPPDMEPPTDEGEQADSE